MKGKTDHTIRKSKYEHLVDLAIIKNISGKIVFKQVVKRINPMKNESINYHIINLIIFS